MRRGESVTFNLSQFPSGKALHLAFTYTIIGIACLVIPFLLPDLGKDVFRQSAMSKLSNFEIDNNIFGGLFTASAHSGDTKPNDVATFMGIYTLTAEGIPLKGGELAAAHVQELENNRFNDTTEQIYQGIVQLKGLGLLNLDETSMSNRLRDKYYNILLQLTERHSAFRLNALHSASISATFFAFSSIEELGKMEEFQKQEEFESAIHFVASMKDTETGGFRDAPGQEPTLLSTYYAVQILAKQKQESELVSKAYEGVARFVFMCQSKDGGFANTAIASPDEHYTSLSSCATTSQAIYILEFLKEHQLLHLYFTDPAYSLYHTANNYQRACLSLSDGVLDKYPSTNTDLEATYYFSTLVNRFPSLAYGTPRALQFVIGSIGALHLLAAIYSFYSPQILRGAEKSYRQVVTKSLFFLSAGAVALQLYPSVAVAIYLIFVVYLTMQYYDVAAEDRTEGFLALVALVNSASYLVLVVVFVYISPYIFVQLSVFYVLVAWAIMSTFVVTLIAVYTVGETKISFYVDAAGLAWITNTVFFYSFLYGSGELAHAYRLLVIHGHFYVVFVTLPIISLVTMYAFAALATVLATEQPKSKKSSTAAIGRANRAAIGAPKRKSSESSDDESSDDD